MIVSCWTMTLNDLADYISLDLPQWQREANLAFLVDLHRQLKPNGIWIWKSTGQIWMKIDDGFTRLA